MCVVVIVCVLLLSVWFEGWGEKGEKEQLPLQGEEFQE